MDAATLVLAKKHTDEQVAQKANIDGYYETLAAGTADNLVDRKGTGTSQNFLYRTSCGDASIADDGSGIIQSIQGNTLIWNQLCPNNILTGTGYTRTSTTITITNNTVTNFNDTNCFIGVKTIIGHKYYLKINSNTPYLRLRNYFTGGAFLEVNDGKIYTETMAGNICLGFVAPIENGTYDLTINVIDLTQMFGAGMEPSTVAEFKEMFPLDYYEYNAGELLNLTATGIKTVGFNAFNIATGTAALLGGNQYQITGTYESVEYSTGEVLLISEGLFTPTENGTLTVIGGEDDVCVHLTWSGYRNGEYEDYWERTHPLPITTITDSNGDAIFPDGLKSAINACDEITPTKAIKRIGVVDMGNLNWSANTGATGWIAPPPSGFKIVSNSTLANMRCIPYQTVRGSESSADIQKTISFVNSSFFTVRDTSYADAAAFKTAMSGVMLYYELAEPVEYEFPESLNLTYKVADFGTEQILPVNDAEPTTAPFIGVIKYSDDFTRQLATMHKNYQSQDSMDALLAELGTACGGTFKKEWDDINSKWTYTFTPTPSGGGE